MFPEKVIISHFLVTRQCNLLLKVELRPHSHALASCPLLAKLVHYFSQLSKPNQKFEG